MKKINCKELGKTDCNHIFEAPTFEALMVQTRQHVMSTPAHAPELTVMQNSSKEERAKWMEDAHALWDSKPEY